MLSDQVLTALIVTAGSVVAAVLTFIGVAYRIKHREPEPEPVQQQASLPLLASYNGTLAEFMDVVVKAHNAAVVQLGTLQEEFDSERKRRIQYESAVGRYLRVLWLAWPGPDKMPDPDPDDRELLGDTLPWIRDARAREPKRPNFRG